MSVSVTVTNGMIAAIDVTDQQETPAFWNSAQEIIPQIIKANQTAGVDAVSGATLSSEAIKAAVDQALAGSVDSGSPMVRASFPCPAMIPISSTVPTAVMLLF